MIHFFGQGLIVGFAIAAPVGVIGLLCIQRTLNQGRIIGLISGLGAATADGLYGCIAGFGLTFISQFLISQQFWFRLIGGLFLLYLGVQTFRTRPQPRFLTQETPNPETQTPSMSGMMAYSSTLLLTLTNPLTILSFLGVFAGLGLGNHAHYSQAAALIFGIFMGSALWWLILSTGVELLRQKLFRTPFNLQKLQWVNRISGCIIIAFGLITLGSLMPVVSPF